MLELETVACNLCGAVDAIPLYTLMDVAHHVPGEFVLRRCARCGLMYLSPRPTPNSLGASYPSDYTPYRRPIEDERSGLMRWIRRRKLLQRRHLVEKYSGVTHGRILDVGCATGLFLHEMQLGGWEAMGIEPIASAAEFAQQRFGLQVFQGMLADAPFEPESFDAMTFWDVLEHTFSPSDELAQAARLLKPNGVISLSVPNWHSVDRCVFGRHWQGLDSPRHLYVFTQDTLTELFKHAGFDVLGWVCFLPGYFSWALSVQRWLEAEHPRFAQPVLKALNFPGVRFPFEPWFIMMNWLGMGGIVSVFARKVASK